MSIPDRNNDPAKFFGDGVTFKAKLIGILEVGDARGDRMCQEALQDLKMAIRAAGEHKQKIVIHVTIDGLRLRDEKTGDSLYHHPVHKISFIAQDMTDSRAFGYIFGSPDSGHRFFGIKTDKAASQVVLAMRDLFQVVFELKKKEIEFARQQFQTKTIHDSTIGFNLQHSLDSGSLMAKISNITDMASTSQAIAKTASPESVTDLVDLEQELSSIQRGISQMERITPCEPNVRPASESEDPFGDSFTNFPTYNLLPPPEPGKTRQAKSKQAEEKPLNTETVASTSDLTLTADNKDNWINSTVLPQSIGFNELSSSKSNETTTTSAITSSITATTTTTAATTIATSSATTDNNEMLNSSENLSSTSGASNPPAATKYIDVFSELDPLGTGKNKPYIDKKFFFHDLKNPPKKVLKDLSGRDVEFPANFDSTSSVSPSLTDGDKEQQPTSIDMNIKPNENDFKVDESKLNDFGKDQFGNNKFDIFDEDPGWKNVIEDPFHASFDRSTPPTLESKKPDGVHSGSLQVNLPPETWSSFSSGSNGRKLESQLSEGGGSSSVSGGMSTARSRPNVFKQNTVDVISSISTKKMKPHIFTQRFAKRDSNSINMRRLQESDSLSENETAPEPPPRHEVTPSIEPPPLPPKKQFSEIIIRPSVRSSDVSASSTTNRYDFMSSTKSLNENGPPLPLPSRKIGKNCDGPERPVKKFHDTSLSNEEYLTPIARADLPVILPPPQQRTGSKTRHQHRKAESSTSSSSFDSVAPPPPPPQSLKPKLEEITLSQLLTLGIDDLAQKLGVPTSKLNTMTIVELTTYLSNFIEDSKKEKVPEKEKETENVFKVSFDEGNEQTFVAKFDESFGNDTFVANFDDFESPAKPNEVRPPSEDRYAVFREIIEQEKSLTTEDTFETPVGSLVMTEDDITDMNNETELTAPITMTIPKIDTKITEVISQAKDRYAALRDIVLLDDDLMDKTQNHPLSAGFAQFDDNKEKFESISSIASPLNILEKQDDSELDSSPEIICSTPSNNDKNQSPSNDEEEPQLSNEIESNKMDSLSVSNVVVCPSPTKDDAEIDVYMQKAISNLSLDSREYLSPITAKIGVVGGVGNAHTLQNASTSPIRNQSPARTSPVVQSINTGTSPIPQVLQKSPLSKSPVCFGTPSQPSPSVNLASLIDETIAISPRSGTSIGVSPLEDGNPALRPIKNPIDESNESWAVFDKIDPQLPPSIKSEFKSKPLPLSKGKNPKEVESPYSSDGKEDWKSAMEYNRRWPNGQTSSSSRDLSPWDEDGPEYRRRYPQDEKGHGPRYVRRTNSTNVDYPYDEKITRRRERRVKGLRSRSRENFESENWHHVNDPNWSPENEDIDNRGMMEPPGPYEMGIYSSPYDKRDHKGVFYDRRIEIKGGGYDKRKYLRDRDYPPPPRMPYDYDPYSLEAKERRANYYDEKYDRRRDRGADYPDEVFDRDREFDRGSRDSCTYNKRDYFYDRDKRSFDRESLESYESIGRPRRSFGSDEMYNSMDGREFRDGEKHFAGDKKKSYRKGVRGRGPSDEYEQDSEGEVRKFAPGETRSLQRPSSGVRSNKSSASSPWDCEEMSIPSAYAKSWKGPGPETDRKLSEKKKSLNLNSKFSGSDGEKDMRYMKSTRSREELDESRSNYASLRYARRRPEDIDFGASTSRRNVDAYYPQADNETEMQFHPETKEHYENKREQFLKSFSKGEEPPRPDKAVRKLSPRGYANFPGRDPKQFATFDETARRKNPKHVRMEFEFDEFEGDAMDKTDKFCDDRPFDGEIKSPLQVPTKNSQFPNDLEKEKHFKANSSPNGKTLKFETDFSSPVSQKSKLRFDDNITKFDPEQMFEDDFSKEEYAFEDDDKWGDLPPPSSVKKGSRQGLSSIDMKKSESVNIFVKQVDDPFEDDDFFKSGQQDASKIRNINAGGGGSRGVSEKVRSSDSFQWDNNLAKYDD